ncbi:MAG: hypothetical protein NTX29_10155 [Actinobacteria bacterium]|nr:hypothetical protein [Actinomycetota bacterium]
MTPVRIVLAGIGIALVAGIGAAPAMATDGFNATIAGQRSFTPLVNLPQSSIQTVDVVNLPAGVGLYALNCKVPADPRSAPTLCDLSTDAAAYLPATDAARATVGMPIKVNAEFYGQNPNPTSGPTADESVDCRADTGNPRATTCAVYVLGAGKESVNPAYLRVFPTAFLPTSAKRMTDAALIAFGDTTVARGAKPKLTASSPVPFAVTLKSGLTPSVSADNCSVAGGKITALKSQGTCIVRIKSTGGKNFKPLVTTQVLRLIK